MSLQRMPSLFVKIAVTSDSCLKPRAKVQKISETLSRQGTRYEPTGNETASLAAPSVYRFVTYLKPAGYKHRCKRPQIALSKTAFSSAKGRL